ncbi:MAG: ABC transporter substrate-binding protein [Alphaproteobacteria bacterium]|nr:ABC transporter substrate-binding protein [Alphaproteobacteria bacterium]
MVSLFSLRQFGRSVLVAGLLGLAPVVASNAQSASDWPTVERNASGQTVKWYAWGGSETINDYIDWVRAEVKARYGVNLKHVKISDTASAVRQVLTEKAAGADSDGAIDMIWINGANFKSMKDNDLLYGPFANDLPNFRYVDTIGKPTTLVDFTVPTDGYEAPWGMAQFVFFYDSARVRRAPKNAEQLLAHIEKNPGRFTYPAPPNFHGTTFLKQLLIDLTPDPTLLQSPPDPATQDRVMNPVWTWLAEARPNLWREGIIYPKDNEEQKRLLDDGEIDFAISFNPGDASSDIDKGVLPQTVRSFVFRGGTIGNTHFVAIPYNSGSVDGALIVANFLMSPEAQLRKNDAKIWGDPTVLAPSKLSREFKRAFENQKRGIATLSAAELGSVLPEPHPDWVKLLETEWQRRHY